MANGAAPRNRARWTEAEDRLVLAGPGSRDPQLARELGRTVNAIRCRRSQLRKGGAAPADPLVDRIPPHLAARLGLRLSDHR
jgi:hypothetical protein